MSCPECGTETEPCQDYDDDDYTIWGECCPNPDCEWTNLWDEEEEYE